MTMTVKRGLHIDTGYTVGTGETGRRTEDTERGTQNAGDETANANANAGTHAAGAMSRIHDIRIRSPSRAEFRVCSPIARTSHHLVFSYAFPSPPARRGQSHVVDQENEADE